MYLGYTWYMATSSMPVWLHTDIPCLSLSEDEDTMVGTVLQIVTDDVPELIPAAIGRSEQCIASIHTRDASGTVYVSETRGDRYTLGDFFSVWGRSFEKNGYDISVYTGDVKSELEDDLILQDHKHVVVVYTRKDISD
jgi:hypothetical protein